MAGLRLACAYEIAPQQRREVKERQYLGLVSGDSFFAGRYVHADAERVAPWRSSLNGDAASYRIAMPVENPASHYRPSGSR